MILDCPVWLRQPERPCANLHPRVLSAWPCLTEEVERSKGIRNGSTFVLILSFLIINLSNWHGLLGASQVFRLIIHATVSSLKSTY